jgi:hypothetical protein
MNSPKKTNTQATGNETTSAAESQIPSGWQRTLLPLLGHLEDSFYETKGGLGDLLNDVGESGEHPARPGDISQLRRVGAVEGCIGEIGQWLDEIEGLLIDLRGLIDGTITGYGPSDMTAADLSGQPGM